MESVGRRHIDNIRHRRKRRANGESGAPTAAAAALMLLASYCIVFTVRRRLDAVVEYPIAKQKNELT